MKYYHSSQILNFNQFDYSLSGFIKRNNFDECLGLSDLCVNLLWIKIDDKDLIFINIDVLYIPTEVSSIIYKYIKEEYNITLNSIIFNASHTHSAPGIEKKFDKMVNQNIVKYLCNSIVNLMQNVSFTDGLLSFKTFKSQKNMWISRRKIGRDIKRFFLKKSMIMLPNEDTEIDTSIRLMMIYDNNKNIDFLFYNFSCHPVFNISSNLSSDFIGQISQILENKLNIKTMFSQGFLGDIRPNFTTSTFYNIGMINKIKLFFNKKLFKKYDKEDFELFNLEISEEIISNVNTSDCTEINYIIETSSFKYKVSSQSKKNEVEFLVKVVLMDKNLFISMPAEVTSKYYIELVKKFTDFNIIPMGLADGMIGYLPYYEEVQDGGYEVNSIVNYGLDSPFCEVSLKSFFNLLQSDIQNLVRCSYDRN